MTASPARAARAPVEPRPPDAGSERPILEVRSLAVHFGGVLAVNNVSFNVTRGSVLGIIGPNGAGKTTVLDALGGFVPSTGRVLLDGKDISDLNPTQRSRARLGRSFQDARLFPSLTSFETLCVAFERHLRREGVIATSLAAPWVRRQERRVATRADELLERMGLSAFRDKFVSELSTGSRRILDLAVVLVHEPLVLLLDEPSSGIAQRETEALGPLLRQVRDETGTTLVVIEHDMPLITSISDELLALETGRVLVQGPPRAVMEDPRLVEAYLGSDSAVIARSGPTDAGIAGNGKAGLRTSVRPRKATGAPKPGPRQAARATKAAGAGGARKTTGATRAVGSKRTPPAVDKATVVKATVRKRPATKAAGVAGGARKTTGATRAVGSKRTPPAVDKATVVKATVRKRPAGKA
ncbi:MAG: ABC transporter ATP-binding protein [Acidimicrobiales bacterium]